MRKTTISGKLVVYHDGQFWVGLYELVENGQMTVARIVFGAEPSDEEIFDLVNNRLDTLRFTEPVAHEVPALAANPKRRQREAAREAASRGPSTKAQQALSEQREALAADRKTTAREKRVQDERERYEKRRQKRKQKHKGR